MARYMWRAGHFYWGNRDENCRGVVVEFAWMLSRRRNLVPYVRLYQSLGWSSLVCHSHMLNLFFQGQATSLALEVLDELCKEMDKRRRPIVFAAFSGGPKSCMYKIFQILQGKCGELKLDSGKYDLVRRCIVGQIYDSSPVDFISELGAKFAVHPTVLNTSHPPKVLRWGAQATAWTLDALFLKRWEDQRAEFWQTLYSTVNTGPILLLCSEDDNLAPFQTICNFASHLRELGGNIKLVAWKSSTHVGHYQHYPKEYKDAVQELLAMAASLYSERMNSLCKQELIRRGPCYKTSEAVCGADEGTNSFHKRLERVASSQIDGQEEKVMQIEHHSSPNVPLFLDNIVLDIGMPKDIEDWEVEPFNSSPGGSSSGVIGQTAGVSVSVKPARSIHRCRL